MSKKKIFVAGHNGMVGSAIIRFLLKRKKKEKIEIITIDRHKLDLTNQSLVQNFFKKNSFDQIYLAAAKVGGIHANYKFPANFIYENLMIQTNIINSAFLSGTKRLLFFGSSCIYPKFSNQPIKENELLTGPLEPTNEPYAISKIAGIKDFKIDGIEKIQCTPESQNSKIYVCDVLVKYEILTSQNSLSELVGFTGKKSEVKKIRIFKGSSGWEIIG